MRTTRTVSISLSPAQLKDVERLAKNENRTMSELVREALRRYQQALPNIEAKTLAEALRLLRDDAAVKGTSKLTKREIDAEIVASRSERLERSARKRSSR